MPSRLLLRAGLRYQIQHPWQALLALIGVALGVAIVLAVDLANSAARANFELSVAQLRGQATHRIISVDDRISSTWYQKLYTTARMPVMAPVISARLWPLDDQHALRLFATDLFAEAAFARGLGVPLGEFDLSAWLNQPGQVMLSSVTGQRLNKQVGDTLQVKIDERIETLQIAGLFEPPSVAAEDLIIADIATGQQLTQQFGFVSYIDLIADNPATISAIKQQLGDALQLQDIAQQTAETVSLSAAFELNLSAMGLLALVVGMFLIFNALSFSIVQRRNLFGRLRALGTRPSEIYQVVLLEALVLAIIGTLIGSMLGILIGRGLTEVVAATVGQLYYQTSTTAMQLQWSSVAQAIGLGLFGTLLAALLPAWQAAATRPASTLSRTKLEEQALHWLKPLALIGALLAITGLIIALYLPGGLLLGFIGLFALILGSVLITPASIPVIQHLLQQLPLSGVARLAVRNLNRQLSRLATAAAALMIALSATVSVTLMVESMRGTVSDWLLSVLNADLYVAAESFRQDTTLPAELTSTIAQLPAVEALSFYRHRQIRLGGRSVELVAATLATPSRAGFQLLSGGPASVWQDFDQGGILLSEPLANRLKLAPGDRLTLPSPSGPQIHSIAGIFRDFSSEHGRVFLDHSQYRQTWDDPLIDNLALFSNSHSAGELRNQIEQLGLVSTPLAFTQAKLIYQESMQVFDKTFTVTDVLRLLSLAVALMGIFTALMAIQLQRRKEFAVLRALGMTRAQLAKLILLESLLLGAIAGVLSLPTGLMMAWILTEAIQLKAFGWTLPLDPALPPMLHTLLLGLIAAFLAALYPAWQASRHNPGPRLRED